MKKIKQQSLDKRLLLSITLFLFWPLGAAIYALYNYRRSWSKNIVWTYVIYFGFTFTIPENSRIDANRYWEYLQNFHQKNISLAELSNTFYKVGLDSNLDIIQPLITLIVAQFTSSYHILYAVVGIIFGYFYTRSIWFVLEKTNRRLNLISSSIIIMLLFIIPIWDMNGMRFWTAAYIFLYGAMQYLYTNKSKYILVIAISFLMHFSFALPCALLVLYKISGRQFAIYYWGFIISLPLSVLSLDSVQNYALSLAPTFIQSKIEFYTSIERYQQLQEIKLERSIFSEVFSYFPLLILTSGYSFYYLHIKKFIRSHESNIQNLLGFSVLMMITFNLIGFIPSMGRFISIALFIFMSFLWISYRNYQIQELNGFIILMSGIYFLYPVGVIRKAIGLSLLNADQLIGSPFSLLLKIII